MPKKGSSKRKKKVKDGDQPFVWPDEETELDEALRTLNRPGRRGGLKPIPRRGT